MFARGMAQATYDGLRRRHCHREERPTDETLSELTCWIRDVLAVSAIVQADSEFLPDYQPQSTG